MSSTSRAFPQVSEAQLIEFAKAIELVGTKVLEGMHLSRRGGEGLEFHSARPYAEGEEARFIDWKRYAATDRYFVKNFERQDRTGWTILIDRSLSMTYGQKLDWALHFAGCLVFLARVLGDQWSLVPQDEADVALAFRNLLEGHIGVDFERLPTFDIPKGNKLILVSDFLFDPALIAKRLEEWRADDIHVCMIQALDKREKEFLFSETIEFRDLESSERLLLDSRAVKKAYLEALSRLNRSWDQFLDSPSFRMEVVAELPRLERQLQELFEHL